MDGPETTKPRGPYSDVLVYAVQSVYSTNHMIKILELAPLYHHRQTFYWLHFLQHWCFGPMCSSSRRSPSLFHSLQFLLEMQYGINLVRFVPPVDEIDYWVRVSVTKWNHKVCTELASEDCKSSFQNADSIKCKL